MSVHHSMNPVIVVEAALKVFHRDLCVGSPTAISERAQERIEDHIICTLHQECLCRGLDPNQQVDWMAMVPRPQPQQKAASGSFGHKWRQQEMAWNMPLTIGRMNMKMHTSKSIIADVDSGSQYRCQSRGDESRYRSHRDQDRPHYKEREYDTFSRKY